jgi:hypothetical protein
MDQPISQGGWVQTMGAVEPALRRRRLLPHPWLWDYLAGQGRAVLARRQVKGPVHVMFLFVDHYEPQDDATVEAWVKGWPALAGRHRDAEGRPPQYGWFWFFPGATPATEARYLEQLGHLAFGGWGEVELHLHHQDDTAQTLTANLQRRLRLSNAYGAMLTAEAEPRVRYGFIHGMWALDNSRLGAFCGVNNELQVLRQTGCYADYTMAAWGPMQSRWVNRLYMAVDDPRRPKSYDTGRPLRAGEPAIGDLLMMQGPTVLHVEQAWQRRRALYDHADITQVELPTPQRLDRWVQQHIHVAGRPEWIFVKVYTHGAVPRDLPILLGPETDALFTDLEQRYNDGQRYVLHYVTAREAANIIQAAVDGKAGDPGQFRDYRVPAPVNRFVHSARALHVRACVPGRVLDVEAQEAGAQRVRLQGFAVREITGDFTTLRLEQAKAPGRWQLTGQGAVTVTLQAGALQRVSLNAQPQDVVLA